MVSMLKRSLGEIAFSSSWGRQMRFIAGPRQAGKTTLAKMKLEKEGTPGLYYLWDLRSIRDRYKSGELFFYSGCSPLKRKEGVGLF